jgi:hypothetical protein
MARPPKPQFRPDEIDPELISLRKTRTGPGPVLSLAVLVLCGYTMLRLRHDFAYALAGDEPADFGAAAAAYAGGKRVPDNGYVTLAGAPDATAPGWLRGKQATGHRLAPILGTSSRLWLHVTDDVRVGALGYDLGWTGRTRRVSELALADELETYVRRLPPQPRVIAGEALAAGAPTADVHGDALALAPETKVVLDERVPGVALVTVYATDQIKDEGGARAGLIAAGAMPAEGLAARNERSWTFEVAAPEGAAALRAVLSRAGFHAALGAGAVTDKVIHHEATWGQLTADPATRAVKLPDGRALPAAQIARLTAWVAPTLPADAEILLVGETPKGYWYTLPLFGVLALVAAAMVWAFVRALRREEPPTAVPEAPPEAPSPPESPQKAASA